MSNHVEMTDGDYAADMMRCQGAFDLFGHQVTAVADNAPCTFGYVLFAKNGDMKWRFGPTARAEYAAKRKRIGERVVNIARVAATEGDS
jgi:hypothetical protein